MSQRFFLFKMFFAPLCVVALLLGGSARADVVDDKIVELKTSPDYKIRVSAGLTLSKVRDQRAVKPFILALKDLDKTVRGVCAAGLGKIVNASTTAELRKASLAKLKKAADEDDNSFVRSQARKAYDKIQQLSPAKKN